MSELEKAIGYVFKDYTLLRTALTHSSYTNERMSQGSESYERMEFLGDSVLNSLSAEYLYKNYPSKSEGELTQLRAVLVCEKSLAHAAAKLPIGANLRLGRGEDITGGRERPSILADVMESLLGAIYLDGGYEPSREFALRFILNKESAETEDAKSALQALTQQLYGRAPEYRIVSETGPDHDKLFVAEVIIEGRKSGSGEGRSKKAAEQAAAQTAYESLKTRTARK